MLEYVNEICKSQSSGAEKREILEKRGSVDLAFPMPDKSARFRTNIFHSKEKYCDRHAADRHQDPQHGRTVPAAAGGAIGRGASRDRRRFRHHRRRENQRPSRPIIGRINKNRAERIITVEDPIEFQHENIKSLVSQVEVGQDSESYDYALRAMMRQDPDVILIGEIRDSFSMTTALRAADTGHLVFTTVHATNAPMTVERMVSLFLPDQKELQQTQLGLNLVAVLTQRLARRRDGKGRVPVVEIMFATPLVRKYILDGEFEKLKACVGNRESGSQSFDQHLTELFTKQIIDVSEAKRLASNVDALNLALRDQQ